jgi:hypothetical protein
VKQAILGKVLLLGYFLTGVCPPPRPCPVLHATLPAPVVLRFVPC